jgi:excinuclease ABC subunit A
MIKEKWIELLGARQHNLKNINVRFPKEKVSVVTGPSGSGKSSLAFDTLFAEGQRRYMESLSTYARQFLEKQEKPDIDDIKGLSPTIAIEQKNHTKNSRSTVGTATEIYDYLRLVFAKMGTMYDPDTGKVVKRDLVKHVSHHLLTEYAGKRAYMCFPVEFNAKSKIQDRKLVLANLLERGFSRAFLDQTRKLKSLVEPIDIQESITEKSNELIGKASSEKKVLLNVDRFTLEEESRGRLEDSLVQAYSEGFGRARVLVVDEDSKLVFESHYTEYPSTGEGDKRYPELSPLLFSFNSPMGACEKCKGFGNILKIDPDLVIPNPMMSISQGAVEPLTKSTSRTWLKQLLLFCQKEKISISLAWQKLAEKDRKKIWDGSGDFPGISGLFEELETEKYKMGVRVFLSRYRSPRVCGSCKGQRLRPESRNVFFHKVSIGDLTSKSISDLSLWFKALELSSLEKEIGKDLFPQIVARLEFLLRVGLDYLSLDRLARTLSGGEAQRIALANQLGARLTQTTYVLDEPSIGLHPRDTERLIGIMRDLAALKNTVVVVEHDPDIIKAADYIVDIGPEAGENGGEILFAGSYPEFLKNIPPNSLTGRFLTHVESVGVPMRRRLDRFKDRNRKTDWIEVTGCKANNLKDVHLRIPLGTLTCVTGVSGSGKSTAIRRTLYPALAKIFMQRVDEMGSFDKIFGFEGIKSVQLIDQDPIGRSPRSNPVTFMKCFDEIRSLFAQTLEARKKHFHAGHFSFNVPGGRCETCEGDGFMRVEMVFMEDIFLKCDMCEGKRYKPEVLAIKYNGKNIDEVLGLTVNEAKRFFVGEGRLLQNLSILEQVGLGYVRLGQSSTTLSGGESQRLKIARELAMSDSNGCVYVLDEPTTGLHFRDVKILLRVLHQLVERGNTVIVVEHNMDVMKSADWILDFGPDGGDKGGVIVAEGTPEDIIDAKQGHTWKYLKAVMESSPKISVPELLSK